jgi:hypothetical protein
MPDPILKKFIMGVGNVTGHTVMVGFNRVAGISTRGPIHQRWVQGGKLLHPNGIELATVNDIPGASEVTFASGDTTPSVGGGTAFRTNNSIATEITTFDDGVTGQVISLRIADVNTTINGALTRTGRKIPCIVGDTFQWMYNGSAWLQMAGSAGMGRYVPVAPPDTVTDWISSSTTSPTNVDLSDDGVRKGAVGAKCIVELRSSVGTAACRCGETGSAFYETVCVCTVGEQQYQTFIVKLDNDATFDARFAVSWTSSTNNLRVGGYWI